MSGNHTQNMHPGGLMVYQVRVKGHLDHQWTDWFGGVTITLEEDGNTLLTCQVIDQAALHGLLRQIRDLGMPLISVNRIEPDEANSSDTETPDIKP